MRTEDIEQQANEEVERLARKYEHTIKKMDMITEDADIFVDSILSELSKRIQIPYHSSWCESAKKRIWDTVYGAKEETKTDNWNERC